MTDEPTGGGGRRGVPRVRGPGHLSDRCATGVLSGALGGGLESRTIVSHLTLFLDRP